MVNTSDGQNVSSTTSVEGETFASKYEKRKRVEDQPRDRFGRWISTGANVKWRADQKDYSGKVLDMKNGKAIVEVNNGNGRSTITNVDPNVIRVIASKASLATPQNQVQDTANNFKAKIQSPAFQKLLSDDGIATIKREDGYTLEAVKGSGQTDPNKDREGNGNPIIFQLFAPSGRSLGTYTDAAVGKFDDMVEADKAANSGENVVTASGQVVRVARDGSSAIIKGEDKLYRAYSLDTGDIVADPTESLSELLSFGSWRKVLHTEANALIASIPVKDIVEILEVEPTPYRVPSAVKEEVQAALSASANFSEEDLKHAKALANNEAVAKSDVEWVNSFFSANEVPQKLRGGYKGQKWASKIINSDDSEEFTVDETKYSLPEDRFEYFAVGEDENSPHVHDVIAVDFDEYRVYTWGDNGFERSDDISVDRVEEPLLMPIDPVTASVVARWLDSDRIEDSFNILDSDPVERNLFAMADPEMDYEELERMSAIIADGIYTPAERSQNAKRQPRGPGGKFGGGSPVPQGKELSESYTKARLEVELPLVVDPSARIDEWLATAPITAAGEAQDSSYLYFAIVDDVDKTAVLDAVAISKDSSGQPKAFLREQATWVASPDTLASLKSAAPPPVVELGVPDPAKAVLAQIDEYDSQNHEAPDTEVAVTAGGYSSKDRKKDAKRGYAMPSGAYPIRDVEDLKNAVKAFGRAKDSEKAAVKRHIRKRAKALNRMDLIPDNWRELSVVERGEELASQSPLYDDFGAIVAAGVPGIADTPSDFKNVRRLKNYWKVGAGAAKIRWGVKGDLTRCHRHLTKYIGSEDAWGFCQNIHMEKFGKSNYKRDNGK